MKILFQGDSITDGARYKSKASEWDKNHQIGHSYVYIIAGLLGMKYPERHYEFINRGISGNRAAALLERWQRDALDYDPDVLSILVGVNDCLFGNKEGVCDLSAGAYEESYRKLLTLSREKNPELKIVRRLAEEFDAVFVPLQEKFDEAMKVREPKYWIWDGTHPTEAGHALIAREFLKATKDVFNYTIE